MTAMAAGLPVISLQTVGVKTGLPRTALLMGIPYEGRLAIAGANFGQAAMPAWVRNLEAHPDAVVTFRDGSVRVTARLATSEEYSEVAAAAREVYPQSARYLKRAAARGVPIFILEDLPA